MGINFLVDVQSANPLFHWRQRRYVGWVILIAYSLFLAYRGHGPGTGGEPAHTLLWDLQDWLRIVGWICGFIRRVQGEFASFIPVGFVAVMVVPGGPARHRWFPINPRALVTGGLLTTLTCAIGIVRSRQLAAVVDLVFPLLGCLLGAWTGMAWLRDWRTRLWFLPKVALLAFLIVFCTGTVLWLALEETPLPLEAAGVTSAQKRQLVHLVRGKNPASLQTGLTHTLRLTEHDANVLLSWGLSSGVSQRKALVGLNHDCASFSMSVLTPLGGGRPRYLNLRMTGRAGIEDGILTMHVNRCRIGSMEVPRWLLHCLGPFATSLLHHDRRLNPILYAMREVAVEPNSIRLTYGPLDLPAGVREGLLGSIIADEELLASTRVQVDHLLFLFTVSPSRDLQPSFNLYVKTAFALARNRSVRGNPATENKAAILALGMLLGHSRIREFLGLAVPALDKEAVGSALHYTGVRGRPDGARHFCVSAAITVLSDDIVSDAGGLLREELDADAGGTGFSFVDLLADRAGTTFALSATRDEAAARAMQDRLARGFCLEDIFPVADDLPEGISAAELQSRYGGVGGDGYRRVIDQIERRIAACAAYQ